MLCEPRSGWKLRYGFFSEDNELWGGDLLWYIGSEDVTRDDSLYVSKRKRMRKDGDGIDEGNVQRYLQRTRGVTRVVV